MNIDKIISYFASYDPSGQSNTKIDTFTEYVALGEYLNGFRAVENKNFDKLSKKKKNILISLYEEVGKSISAILTTDNKIPIITKENCKEYLDIFTNIRAFGYANKQKDLELLKLAFDNYIKENNINISHLNLDGSDEDFTNIVNFLYQCNYTATTAIKNKDKTLQLFKTPYNNIKLKNIADNYIAKNNIKPLVRENYDVDIGNGKFDKTAVQQEGNCWLHAGINSLLHSDEGKKLLESNRYYDETTGVFVIHLQEAEDNNMHDGIYIITPDDIASEAGKRSLGEGDITAYAIAVNRYFSEMRKSQNLGMYKDTGDGNGTWRMFEILTGGSSTFYNARKYDPTIDIQEGIGIFTNCDSVSFKELYDIIQKKEGVVVGAVGNIESNHAISFIGVKEGKLLVQESNNKDNFSEWITTTDGREIFQKTENLYDANTFEITEDNFKKWIFNIGILKWK